MENFIFPLYKLTTAAQNEVNANAQTSFDADDNAYVVTESLVSFDTDDATGAVTITLADPVGDYDRVGYTVCFNLTSYTQDATFVAPNAADDDDSSITLVSAGDSVTFMWNGTFWQTVGRELHGST